LFSIDSALQAFPFFAIGSIIKTKNILKPIEQEPKKYLPIIMIFVIVGYILLVVIVPFNGGSSINGFNFGKNIMLFYILGIIGIISTISISLLYMHQKLIITIIASGTIIIMAFHLIISGLIFRITGLRGEEIINPLIGASIAVINILIFILPILLIKKYFPILIGRRK
jgi:hypothetical protein